MNNTILCTNPLVQSRLSILRDKNTTVAAFRKFIFECGALIGVEIAQRFQLADVQVETPLELATVQRIQTSITLVVILRAALGFIDGLASFLPDAKIGHIGLYRDEITLQPIHYYSKLPQHIHKDMVILGDPMLATGGSIIAGLTYLQELRCTKNVVIASLIASPEGIRAIRNHFPEVPIYTAAVDRRLNDKGYILPGLGDAGDRQYGTL